MVSFYQLVQIIILMDDPYYIKLSPPHLSGLQRIFPEVPSIWDRVQVFTYDSKTAFPYIILQSASLNNAASIRKKED